MLLFCEISSNEYMIAQFNFFNKLASERGFDLGKMCFSADELILAWAGAGPGSESRAAEASLAIGPIHETY